MANYVMLANFTDQGIRNVKDTVKRAEAFKEMAKAAGVTVKDLYWTLGQFDIVYAWGVLHHTGDMWHAMENVAPLVADLFFGGLPAVQPARRKRPDRSVE